MIRDFLEKLRSLPDRQKIIIFFVIMGVAALIAGFVGMRLVIHDFSKLKNVGIPVPLPNVQVPDSLKKLGKPQDETADWKMYTSESLGFSLEYPLDFTAQDSQVSPGFVQKDGKGALIVRKFDNLNQELSDLKKITSDSSNTENFIESETIINGFGAKDISYEQMHLKSMSEGPLWEITIYIPEKNINISAGTKYQEYLPIFRKMISTFKFTK